MRNIYTRCLQVLSSKYFLHFVVFVFIIQSLWIAFSIAYPLVYDEAFHFPVIEIYGKQLSPFIFNQPEAYDIYGNLTYNSGSLFHYLLSFPFRIISVFTEEFMWRVISLRIINIAFVAVGLYLFSSLFKKIGIRQIYTNIALLLFVLIPLVPFVAATINYDNLLFPVAALYFIQSVELLKSRKIKFTNLALIISLGSLASVIKVAFLPMFALTFIYFFVILVKRHKKLLLVEVFKSAKKTTRSVFIIVAAFTLISISLFSVRYIYAFVQFGTPMPTCQQVTEKRRCIQYSDSLIQKYTETKYDRKLKPFPEYALQWYSNNLEYTNRAVAVGQGWGDYQRPLPIFNILFFVLTITGSVAVIYVWRTMRKPKDGSWQFLMYSAIGLTLITFIFNYDLYLKLHYPFAIQPRYLLIVVPIIMVFMILAVSNILHRYRYIKLPLLLTVLLLFTQGGGITTYIVRSQDFWFWDRKKVINTNQELREVLKPLVEEE